MRARFVFFLSRRMLRGKAGTGRYLRGAVLGIAVSLVPLIVVMEVSTGMIEGITARLLEVGTYHLQCPLPPDIAPTRLDALAAAVRNVPGVVAAVPERIGTAMIVSASGASGASIRFVPPGLFTLDKGFAAYVTLREGDTGLDRWTPFSSAPRWRHRSAFAPGPGQHPHDVGGEPRRAAAADTGEGRRDL